MFGHRMGALALAVGISGCSGGKDEPIVPRDTDADTDTDTEEPVDTGFDGPFLDVSAFAVTARFAYDPDAALHVSYGAPETGLAPVSIEVMLIDNAALYGGAALDENTSCTVTLEASGSVPPASWAADGGAWTGLDLPSGATVRDRCRFYGLPGEFERDAGKHVSKWRWGAGIGPLDPAVAEQLRATLPPSEWAALEPFAVGAIAVSDAFSDGSGGLGRSDLGIGLGFEVNASYEIVVGGTGNFEPVPADEIERPEGGVARAYYEARSGPFGPISLLTREPGAYR